MMKNLHKFKNSEATLPQTVKGENDYELLLQKAENEIRQHIRVHNRIHLIILIRLSNN